MKKYRYAIIVGCCLALLIVMALPATKVIGAFNTRFFDGGGAPAAGWALYQPKKSGYQLNLVPGAAKVSDEAATEGFGSISNSVASQESNKMTATQRNQFTELTANTIKLAKEQPVSTFSIDVDTASYGFVRNLLNSNLQPTKDAVRIEELVNYFPYDYPAADNLQQPFKTTVKVLPCPWNPANKLMHIGIKGYQHSQQTRPKANLVFLIDVSGSMADANKLSLVQPALKMLLDTLNADDSVAIVTYAEQVKLALEPTNVRDKAKIINVIDSLHADGGTAGGAGIQLAYQTAKQHFDAKGVNRVILATDGDFNIGISDPKELKSFIERERASGIALSVLGFGLGNYNDALMQTLAQNGNGNALYIDTLNEARKALVDQAGATLFTIAKDVKIQVEFNPAQIAEYRLLGYESRLLNREDFNNDQVDAGEIGSGHTVTAIYEITPVGSQGRMIDALRYQAKQGDTANTGTNTNEYAQIKIRYKLPHEDVSQLINTIVDARQELTDWQQASEDTRFSVAVAAFGQLLRGDPTTQKFTYQNAIELAQNAKGSDPFGYRAEFINLIRLAKALPVTAAGN
ncbi:MAG: VWA domain-containing protein [Methylococcaceae bacterium]|nr:VWA domain-containing protein [Methylococcaceae bacterium]MDP3904525.1 VWA domain-containing protein [Methylococcaceae bacterium]